LAYPVVAVSLPANLGGTTNGQLPAAILAELEAPGRPLARAHTQTVRSWRALVAEVADRFGEALTVTSTADAYRSYTVQKRTFEDRYTTTYLPGRPSKMWNGTRWYQKPGTAMAAVPGTSNHGWGLALDICLWRNDAIVSITANTNLFGWLLVNADLFGFSWEAQSEPWHLRLFTGDHTPAAVLDFETPPPPPTPPPALEHDDMAHMSRSPEGVVWVIATACSSTFWVTEDQHNYLKATGAYTLIPWDPELMKRIPQVDSAHT
jgi:hypothetical protein